jgi:hypothetical protein
MESQLEVFGLEGLMELTSFPWLGLQDEILLD